MIGTTGTDGLLVWLAIAAIAIGTWAFRVSFVILFDYLDEIPPRITRVIRFIPPAVLAAIIGPRLLLIDGSTAVTLANERLLAGLVAMVVAWYTERMFVTIAVGMATLWVLVFVV